MDLSQGDGENWGTQQMLKVDFEWTWKLLLNPKKLSKKNGWEPFFFAYPIQTSFGGDAKSWDE